MGNRTISDVFSARDKEDHSMKRNIIINFYKLSSILRSEYLVDETINALCEQIEPRFIDGPNADSVCELDKWLYFYAWEIVGQLSLSKPMGFTKAGADHSGMMDTAEKAMDYFAVVGQIPALDKILAKNPLFSVGPPSWEAATRFCFQHTMARQQDVDQKSSEKRDMLDNFLELKKTVGLDDYGVVGSLMVNIVAGADTVGILSRAIVYHVLKNANILAKLRDELDNANLQTPISFATATKLPYLEAIILESCRMHPGVTLLLERVVPEPGLQLPNGTFLPPGTKVGMNAWVVHQNKAVFGQDAASFGPERWLQQDWENDQEFAGRLANMKRSDLTFGAGKRSCLGKDVAMLETYKLITTLFLKYDIYLVDPHKEWEIQNSWFIRQSGIDVRFRRRIPS